MRFMLILIGALIIIVGAWPLVAGLSFIPPSLSFIPVTGAAYQAIIIVIGVISLLYGINKGQQTYGR